LIFRLIVLTLIFQACSNSHKTNASNARRNIEEYYQSSGVVRYMLTELPVWANGSVSGGCQRQFSFNYFNFFELTKNFAMEFSSAWQAQMHFNYEKTGMILMAREAQAKMQNGNKEDVKDLVVGPGREEQIFYQSMDKVKANFPAVNIPTYKRVNILWIDPLLDFIDKKWVMKPGVANKFKGHSLLNSGHPAIVSFCLSAHELENLLESERLAENNIRLFAAEGMTIYRTNFLPNYGLYYPLRELFEPTQNLYLYSPGKVVPAEIGALTAVENF